MRDSTSTLGRRTFAAGFEDAFDVAVPVEAAEGGEAPGDGGSHSAIGFHGPPEFPRCARRTSRRWRSLLVSAPFGEEPKIGGVAHERVAGVPGEEPGDCCAFGEVEWFVDSDEFGGDDCCGHGGLLDDPRPLGRDQGIDQIHTRS